MSRIALIDLKHPSEGFANRDQTGGCCSKMQASGIVGRVASLIKRHQPICFNLHDGCLYRIKWLVTTRPLWHI